MQASDIIAIIAVVIAIYSCWQNSKALRADIRPYLYLDLIASTEKNPKMYLRLRNVGRTGAIIDSISTSVDVKKYQEMTKLPFPFIGLTEFVIPPQTSKIGIIELKKIKEDQWINIDYHDELGKPFSLHFPIKSFGETALATLAARELFEC